MLTQLAAACASLTVWAFGALARWRFDDTGDRVTESQENVEAAILAMGNRIALEMSTLDNQYRGKINQLYSETQGKLDAMDELLRNRLTTASTTTTTINTIFNRFNEGDKSPAGERFESEGVFHAAESILVKPFLENDDVDIVANKKKYGKKKYDPQRVLNAWRQNWNLLPDGAVGLTERDKLDLNYDELYGKQDLKDLADDISWFNEEDMDKTGVVGHFEDAGEQVYRLYESDLEGKEDFYYSDYDYDEESYSGEEKQEEKVVDEEEKEEEEQLQNPLQIWRERFSVRDYDEDSYYDRDVNREEGEKKQKEEEKVVEEEGADHATFSEVVNRGQQLQDKLQIWEERFSTQERFSNSERTRPRPEQVPADDSASGYQIIFGENDYDDEGYYDSDVSGEEEEEETEHATFSEVVDRGQQLKDKLQTWQKVFSVRDRFSNSERTRPQPEQTPADDSPSGDKSIFGENPKPNANPSILALMK